MRWPNPKHRNILVDEVKELSRAVSAALLRRVTHQLIYREAMADTDTPATGSSTPRAFRRSVSYIDKSREYYAAHGYTTPYMWASYPTVPWTPLAKPLAESTVAVVTTAYPAVFEAPKKVYAQDSLPVPDAMFTKDLSWDKDATHTDDVASFLPLAGLEALAGNRIGSMGERFYGVPTNYSQSRTRADAEQVLEWCNEDSVDVAILVPL